MSDDWLAYVIWIVVAAGSTFGISLVFAGILKWKRKAFLIPYILASIAFIAGYIVWTGTDALELIMDNAVWGLVGAAVLSAILIRNVLGQPGGPREKGAPLAIDMVWSGAIYGSIDSIMLTVIPVLAVNSAFSASFDSELMTRASVGLVALLASIFVAVAYHAGYPEFRGSNMRFAAIGIGLGTLVFLITGSVLAPVLSHALMHMAAVYHGPEGTVQLPPHASPEP